MRQVICHPRGAARARYSVLDEPPLPPSRDASASRGRVTVTLSDPLRPLRNIPSTLTFESEWSGIRGRISGRDLSNPSAHSVSTARTPVAVGASVLRKLWCSFSFSTTGRTNPSGADSERSAATQDRCGLWGILVARGAVPHRPVNDALQTGSPRGFARSFTCSPSTADWFRSLPCFGFSHYPV